LPPCDFLDKLHASLAWPPRGGLDELRRGDLSGRVRKWPEADFTWAQRGVRFEGESGHDADWLSLPSLTLSGHERLRRDTSF
jgi:hypothetical protein